jgi:hypothetical protein
MKRITFAILLALLIPTESSAQVTPPQLIIQRYYCIAGEQPLYADNYFLAGHIDISAHPIELWCTPLQ